MDKASVCTIAQRTGVCAATVGRALAGKDNVGRRRTRLCYLPNMKEHSTDAEIAPIVQILDSSVRGAAIFRDLRMKIKMRAYRRPLNAAEVH